MVLILISLACWLVHPGARIGKLWDSGAGASALACALFLLFAWLPLKGLMSFAVLLNAP